MKYVIELSLVKESSANKASSANSTETAEKKTEDWCYSIAQMVSIIEISPFQYDAEAIKKKAEEMARMIESTQDSNASRGVDIKVCLALKTLVDTIFKSIRDAVSSSIHDTVSSDEVGIDRLSISIRDLVTQLQTLNMLERVIKSFPNPGLVDSSVALPSGSACGSLFNTEKNKVLIPHGADVDVAERFQFIENLIELLKIQYSLSRDGILEKIQQIIISLTRYGDSGRYEDLYQKVVSWRTVSEEIAHKKSNKEELYSGLMKNFPVIDGTKKLSIVSKEVLNLFCFLELIFESIELATDYLRQYPKKEYYTFWGVSSFIEKHSAQDPMKALLDACAKIGGAVANGADVIASIHELLAHVLSTLDKTAFTATGKNKVSPFFRERSAAYVKTVLSSAVNDHIQIANRVREKGFIPFQPQASFSQASPLNRELERLAILYGCTVGATEVSLSS